MTGAEQDLRQLMVGHGRTLPGAGRRLHNSQRPLTHDRLLYLVQLPLGWIARMPATGQLQTIAVFLHCGHSIVLTVIVDRARPRPAAMDRHRVGSDGVHPARTTDAT